MPIRIRNFNRCLCWIYNHNSEFTFYFSTTYPTFFTTYGKPIYKVFPFDIMTLSTQERQGSMKIRIELEEGLAEDEVVIRCQALSDEIRQIQNVIGEISTSRQSFALYKGDAEYYVALEDILFFETESNGVNAHTRDDVYQVKYRLYELEEILPVHFLRISKSTIINVKEVYSLRKSSLSTTSVAAFSGSHKQVFVSRHYVRQLKEKLTEMRMR